MMTYTVEGVRLGTRHSDSVAALCRRWDAALRVAGALDRRAAGASRHRGEQLRARAGRCRLYGATLCALMTPGELGAACAEWL